MPDAAMQQMMLQAELERCVCAILAGNPRYADPLRLNRHEQKAFSQFGEDGILQEIFRRLGTTNRYFVEFGVEGGLENNTAHLLLQGWAGCWLEAGSDHVAAIRRGFAAPLRDGKLTLLHERVTADRIDALFTAGGVPREFDLLSIDIDGNDYWVWQALERFKPRVVVIEYNAAYPPPTDWVMPHDPAYTWNGTAFFGASLQALERLGKAKGYALVGCSLGGANAFFVRQELVRDRFCAPFTAENHFEPPRYFLAARHAGHPRSYAAFGLA